MDIVTALRKREVASAANAIVYSALLAAVEDAWTPPLSVGARTRKSSMIQMGRSRVVRRWGCPRAG